jgi:hypothetical protein
MLDRRSLRHDEYSDEWISYLSVQGGGFQLPRQRKLGLITF